MPYSGVDSPAVNAKIERCVEKVMAEGHDKSSAIAICRASMEREADMSKNNSQFIDKPSEETSTKDTKPLADSVYLSAISDLVATLKDFITSFKAGARHSKSDNDKVQAIHDDAVALGAECMGKMSVVKQSDGKLRWVMFSSTAYQDKDGEIVSQKALEEDVARMDASGDYGPLDWWHVNGLNLGQCDYNAMDGRVLIESGTFKNKAIGEAIQANASKLGGSISFYHPPSEPDNSGVYKNIRRFARALLPIQQASNLFTRLTVKESSMNIAKEKFDALKDLVGDSLAQELIAQSESVQKAAEAAGVKFKETSEYKAAKEDAPPAKKLGDMTEADLKEFIQKCMMDMGDKSGKKEAEDTHSEATKALREEITKLKNLQSLTKTRTDELEAKLSELSSEQPRANIGLGYRPTQDPNNVRKEAQKSIAGQPPIGPSVDPGFMQFLSGQGRSDPSAVA